MDDVLCKTYLLTMGYTAQTVGLVISGGLKEGVPAYIGAPPAEIAGLVDETRQAAEDAGALADTAREACPGDDCVGAAFQFERAWGDLVTAFNKWEPYGVS